MNRCFIPLVWLILSSTVWAEDWPTYGHNVRRTNVTAEALSPPLHLQWTYHAPAPPAAGWSLPVNGYGARKNKANVSFDDCHPAIAVGERVYFSSSAENCVYATEAASGKVVWRFITGAAPRLAPTYWDGRVYFGADDGQVYCLDAATGTLKWKFDATVATESMLGYGRFSSVWPIRTGIMIDDGAVWFTAGLFPGEGIFLHKLDPSDGKVLWRRDISRLSGQTTKTSVAPQGYILASQDSLYLTSRVTPTRFSKRDGTFIPFSTPPPDVPKSHEYRFHNGGDYAQLWDDRTLVYGQACLFGYDPDQEWTNRYRKTERGQLKFHWFNARQTIHNNEVVYFATDNHLLAIDRKDLEDVSKKEARQFEDLYKRLRVADRMDDMQSYAKLVEQHGPDHPLAKALQNGPLRYSEKNWQQWLKQSPDVFAKLRARCLWMTSMQATESLVLSGDILFAGGDEAVHAVDAKTGQQLWEEQTQSRVRGIVVSNGRLIVSTVDGKVRCYAASQLEDGPRSIPTRSGFSRKQEKASHQEILASIEDDQSGYALVLGDESGVFTHSLLEHSKLNIQLLVSDQRTVAGLREKFANAGLYGHRVTVVLVNAAEPLPFPPYLFNYVVDMATVSEQTPVCSLDETFRVTRPLGGKLITAATIQAIRRAVGESEIEVESIRDTMCVVKRAALLGSRDWTHNYGSPANTSCSEDQLVKGPFGILWYGEPGPRLRIDRHARAPMPLVANGILFTIGYDRVMAYDAYNGVKYWERKIEGATRTGLPLGTSNIVADKTGLFVVVKDRECWHLDAKTGITTKKFTLPDTEQGSQYWGWLARHDSLLLGSRSLQDPKRSRPDQKHSNQLFAIRLATGEHVWQQTLGKIEHDGVAIHDGKLFYVEQELTEKEKRLAREVVPGDAKKVVNRKAVDRRGNPIQADLRKLVCLDVSSGETLWETPFDASDLTLDDNAVLDGRSGVSCMVKDGRVVVHGVGSVGHPHREFLAGEFARRAIFVFAADSGRVAWSGRKGYRKRPIIAGDYIYAEPFAWSLQTGAPKTILNPLSGEPQPFDFHRGYVGCSHLLASGCSLFGNKDGIGYCNLDSREGFSAFRSLALACGLNATPANGIFVAPEGRSGCTCAGSGIHTSVALYPRALARDWAVGVAGGQGQVNTFPIRHAYINLGAPGYREDKSKRLWLPYPPTRDDGVTGGWLPRYQHQPEMFAQQPAELAQVTDHHIPWLFASSYQNEKPLTFNLQEKEQPKARYRIALFFAEFDAKAGRRVFDVQLQGKTVAADLDVAKEANGTGKALVKIFRGVEVGEKLAIKLRRSPKSEMPPLLCAIAVERESE